VVRGAREKAARLPVRDLSIDVGGLPSGRRPEFLCGPGDRTAPIPEDILKRLSL